MLVLVFVLGFVLVVVLVFMILTFSIFKKAYYPQPHYKNNLQWTSKKV